mmetsp:Transcript_24040/g.37444  ORF Transcript_24040/g.37444 Transcript_24040/m.37444 type:complete len:153 (-) Transcript_24040:98-556(-)
MGSCGNACCKMQYGYDSTSPEDLKNELLKDLSMGGPDNQYALQTTADAQFGFTDLTPYNLSDPVTGMNFSYLGQAVHTTGPLGVECVFHDYVNFLIGTDPHDNDKTTLIAFSISQQAGALGDDGQNYYNIYTAVQATKPSQSKTLLGCPPPM